MSRKSRETKLKALAEIQRQNEQLAYMRGITHAHDAASFGWKPLLPNLPEFAHTHTQAALDAFVALDRCAKVYTDNETNMTRLANRIEELTPLRTRLHRKATQARIRLRNAKLALNGTLH